MSVSRREALRKLGMSGVAAAAAPSWVEALTELAQGHVHPAPGSRRRRRGLEAQGPERRPGRDGDRS